MSGLSLKIISLLLASNGDDAGWMQFLVFAIMAVIWIVGGIIKMKANKVSQIDEDEESGSKLQAKPEFQQKTQKLPKKIHLKTSQPTIHKPQPRQELLYMREYEQPEPIAVNLEPKRPAPKPRREMESLEPKTTHSPQISESLALDNVENLRKAILHYEILGKPKALKDYEI